MKDLDLVGLGSVVVDLIARVPLIAGPESKVPSSAAERFAGGVTLNHLAWAAGLGLRAGLLGQGADDPEGRFLRLEMERLGVDHAGWLAGGRRTSVARIYVDARGERAIYMDAAPLAALRPGDVARWRPWLKRARAFSTEVSLLRLKTVAAALRAARSLGCLTAIDLDIPPSRAGVLGTRAELEQALGLADLVKASSETAQEAVGGAPPSRPEALALALHRRLRKRPGSQWVALTAGSRGAAASDGRRALFLPAFKGVRAVDSTGAGDAFFGGLIAARLGGLPLARALRLANACGAACVAHRGAVPAPGASVRALKLAHQRGFKMPKRTSSPPDPAKAYLASALRELGQAAARLDRKALARASRLILASSAQGGRLHVTGIGKSEPVARYVAASFSSTGTPAFFLHGTEAVHGSLGALRPGEVLLAISNSGETAELKSAVAQARRLGAQLLAVTSSPRSWLARRADLVLLAKVGREGDRLGLAPRNSVLAQMLVLNALGVALQEARGLTAAEFRRFHPAGPLGRKARRSSGDQYGRLGRRAVKGAGR